MHMHVACANQEASSNLSVTFLLVQRLKFYGIPSDFVRVSDIGLRSDDS